ncbi:MAG TPA: serine/threonine protein kinase, partial [Nannocystis exedens]|nr:serine/threonine protein kinase [Nannocystis exedens]
MARAFSHESAAQTQGSIGTLVYMAPEQVTSESTDPRTDIYALGLLLFEMLTGELAFRAETPLATALARLHDPPPDPRAQVPELPDRLAELILHCLEREPERRPQSAAEIAGGLLSWLESAGQSAEKCASMLQTSLASTSATGQLMKEVTRGSSTGGSSTPASSATMSRRTPADTMGRVAVLPLRFRGRSEHDYLGETLGEAIVDLLGRTRGVEVASASSSARFTDERDPSTVGAALNVSYVVDGTIQVVGPNARVTVRLVDVQEGTHLWSRRFTGSLEDPFEFQDLLAQQIGEDLRTEMLYASYRGSGSEEVIALCRQSRKLLVSLGGVFEGGFSDFRRLRQKYPNFMPLLPLLAQMSLRGWFMDVPLRERAGAAAEDWQTIASTSVELARRQAGDLPETHLALAILAVHEGHLRDAVIQLRACLSGAPAYPAALQYFGNLQCEAGRAEEGLARIKLALALQPEQPAGLFEYARCSALRGDLKTYAWAVKELKEQKVVFQAPLALLQVRVAVWFGDRETIERILAGVDGSAGIISRATSSYGRAVLGLETPSIDFVEQILSQRINPRYASMICQIAAEQFCAVGQPELALDYFHRAADSVLIDLEWTDNCPVLAAMREL